MTKHQTGTRQQWLEARLKLLKAEKEHTRQGDELARLRRELPWVRVEKEYRFKTDSGEVALADLFKGRSQLLVYHFMFGADYKAGCPHCSAIADGFNGIWKHLAGHDVMFWAVSRAPLEKLQAYKKRLGWSFPWASSGGSDFNLDFHVSFTKEQQNAGDIEYNFRKKPAKSKADNAETSEPPNDFGRKIAASAGTDWPTFIREMPGMSAFSLADGVIYHTYSTYAPA